MELLFDTAKILVHTIRGWGEGWKMYVYTLVKMLIIMDGHLAVNEN